MIILKKMSIFNYFVVCILAFHQVQLGKSEEVDSTNRTRIRDTQRIIGAPFALRGEIKYVVVTHHDDLYYMCGGGIIDNYYILSAAHCFINDKDEFGDDKITVVAGITDYNNERDRNRVEVDVEKVYVHKGYRDGDLIDDIAILKLKNSLDIEENKLEKLSVPTKARNLTNRMALMAGFGYDKHRTFRNAKNELDEEGSASGFLRKADILMFSNRDCQKLYPNDKIPKTNLCGKMVKENARKEYGVCNGDSGSPLVLDTKGLKEVVGVVSWSYGCNERKVPLVYTRVTQYLNFIEEAKNDITDNARVKVFD